MAMTIPQLTPLPAGYVVQLSDMEALCSACTFLMGKPLTRVHTATAGQSLPSGGAFTPVNFDTLDFDSDGMWSASAPSRLTIQTPGFYAVRYVVSQDFAIGVAEAEAVTGPGNPAGSGNLTPYYSSYCAGHSNDSGLGGAGVIGQYMYAGDYVQIAFTGASASTVVTTTTQPSLALELVSI